MVTSTISPMFRFSILCWLAVGGGKWGLDHLSDLTDTATFHLRLVRTVNKFCCSPCLLDVGFFLSVRAGGRRGPEASERQRQDKTVRVPVIFGDAGERINESSLLREYQGLQIETREEERRDGTAVKITQEPEAKRQPHLQPSRRSQGPICRDDPAKEAKIPDQLRKLFSLTSLLCNAPANGGLHAG